MATTLADVFNAGRTITRMDGADYNGCIEGYRADSNRRRCQRNAANCVRSELMLPWDTIIPAGEYGRITIQPDGSIYYCAGQYAPTEYYFHVEQLCYSLARMRETVAV
jgi:hypothetical protein